jgi:Mce-associated membrane protein
MKNDDRIDADSAEIETSKPVDGDAEELEADSVVESEPDDAETGLDADQTETAKPVDGDAEELEADSDVESEPDDAETAPDGEQAKPTKSRWAINRPRILAYAVLPGLVLLLAVAAGFFKWQDSSARSSAMARIESVAAAKESTIALLSYRAETVEKDLGSVRDRLTGAFQESYMQLTHDVVIPGAKEKHISAVATVPAAASVSATPSHAVVLLFVNQTATVGTDPPSNTASSVRVTLEKAHGRWLVSAFDPV